MWDGNWYRGSSDSVEREAFQSVKKDAAHLILQLSATALRTYTGEVLPVLGQVCVDVDYDNKKHHRTAQVVAGKAQICRVGIGCNRSSWSDHRCGKGIIWEATQNCTRFCKSIQKYSKRNLEQWRKSEQRPTLIQQPEILQGTSSALRTASQNRGIGEASHWRHCWASTICRVGNNHCASCKE